jgi:cytochrome c556
MVLLLKNKSFVISVLLFSVLFLANCSGGEKKQEEKAKTDSIASCNKPLNPNGDSELALLMREMMGSASNLKEMIKKGELPEKFPEEFLKIHTAKPTDSDTKKASFDGFADNYLTNLQALYHSPKEDLTKNYNAVINACASCHSQHCPGPLKAINKLRIE